MNAHAQPAAKTVRTTCPYCGVGCGVIAKPDGFGGAEISGDPDHPANFGRLCSKGSALGETLALDTRLLKPRLHGVDVAWNEALDHVADELARIRAAHGPNSIAFYLSGQLLTEDYYIANKLMKGFIGSANVDTNSRLCMASTVAGHRRAFGSDTVPGNYEDIDEADLIVLVGSNAAWCHPVLYQRMMRAKETRGARIVTIDPRLTATAETGDLHLSIAAGMDGALFSGLLSYLAVNEHLDARFIEEHTERFDAALSRARDIGPDVAGTARACGLDIADVENFFKLWANTSRVVTLTSQGVNQSAVGTDKVNAIINCHLATGRIGKLGMGPLSLTGQPNAMGGREVGGLANQLAAHMGFSPDEVDRVGRFWSAPAMADKEGLKAVAMFDAIARGEIKALWVMGTNPAVSLPRADDVRDALSKLELFVVSENVASNDTVNAGAHVLLPAAAWGEKDGTVTNSERRISRQSAFLDLPGDARPDWWIMREVATRMGFGARFAYEGPAAIFAEHAALSAFENNGARDFDIGGLAGLDRAAFDALPPTQWPIRVGEERGRARMFDDGVFFTPSGKAQFVAIENPASTPRNDAYPLTLNTGRYRDQWHTMTRTGLSRRLAQHRPEPIVEIHPDDAARSGVVDGGLTRVSTLHGETTLRVHVTTTQRRGALFAPIHWSDETSGGARVGSLVHPLVDPHSGQPDSKATSAAIAPLATTRAGFVLARARGALPAVYAWVSIPCGYAAGIETDAGADELLSALAAKGDVASYRDPARGIERFACIEKGSLTAVLFLGGPRTEQPWASLLPAWEAPSLTPTMRSSLLSGRTATSVEPSGALVCACFGVPEKVVAQSIEDGARSVEAIGGACRAGTNCGSCVPEIRKLLASALAPA
jgi:assimilatory nitrate reductase catalytic subunit